MAGGETGWSLWSPPTQTILWFHDSVVQIFSDHWAGKAAANRLEHLMWEGNEGTGVVELGEEMVVSGGSSYCLQLLIWGLLSRWSQTGWQKEKDKKQWELVTAREILIRQEEKIPHHEGTKHGINLPLLTKNFKKVHKKPTFDPVPVWSRRSDERASNLLCHFTYSSVLRNLYQGTLEKGFCPRVYITLHLFSASKYFRL